MKKIVIGILVIGLFCVFGESNAINSGDTLKLAELKNIKEQSQKAYDRAKKDAEDAEKNATITEKKAKEFQEKANNAKNSSDKETYQKKADEFSKKAKKARAQADATNDSEKFAKAANEQAQAATTVEEAEKYSKLTQTASATSHEITKDRSFWLSDVYIDMIELIEKSSTFDVSGTLKIGNEGELKINAEDDNTNILHKALNLMIKVMGTLAVLLYVVGGFFYITSQGDENQIQKGKTILTYTSLGLAIAFASYLLVYLVMSATFTLS